MGLDADRRIADRDGRVSCQVQIGDSLFDQCSLCPSADPWRRDQQCLVTSCVVQDVVDLPELCLDVARGESRPCDHQQFGESLLVGWRYPDVAVNHRMSRPGLVDLRESGHLPSVPQELSQEVKRLLKQVFRRAADVVHPTFPALPAGHKLANLSRYVTCLTEAS